MHLPWMPKLSHSWSLKGMWLWMLTVFLSVVGQISDKFRRFVSRKQCRRVLLASVFDQHWMTCIGYDHYLLVPNAKHDLQGFSYLLPVCRPAVCWVVVPSFPESIHIQDFLPSLSSICVMLWKTSAIPLRSLIPEQEVADSKKTQVHRFSLPVSKRQSERYGHPWHN